MIYSLTRDFDEYRMSCERLWLVRQNPEEYIEQNLLEYRKMIYRWLYRGATEVVSVHNESTDVLWFDSEAMEISGVDTWPQNRKNFTVKPKDIV